MACSKSLSVLVLCFLIVAATSQELSLDNQLNAMGQVTLNKMGRKAMMKEALVALEEKKKEEMMEALSSLNDKLAASCTGNTCFDYCGRLTPSKWACALDCGCTWPDMEAQARMI